MNERVHHDDSNGFFWGGGRGAGGGADPLGPKDDMTPLGGALG